MSVEEIKKHLEEKGKDLDNNTFRVKFLHDSVKSVIGIHFPKLYLNYYISDDTKHKKKFFIDINEVNNTYYCNDDGMEVFLELLDGLIIKQIDIYEHINTINKGTIISKLRKSKIKKILS